MLLRGFFNAADWKILTMKRNIYFFIITNQREYWFIAGHQKACLAKIRKPSTKESYLPLEGELKREDTKPIKTLFNPKFTLILTHNFVKERKK